MPPSINTNSSKMYCSRGLRNTLLKRFHTSIELGTGSFNLFQDFGLWRNISRVLEQVRLVGQLVRLECYKHFGMVNHGTKSLKNIVHRNGTLRHAPPGRGVKLERRSVRALSATLENEFKNVLGPRKAILNTFFKIFAFVLLILIK